jgi:hypothetical protein
LQIVWARVFARDGQIPPLERLGIPAPQFVWHCQTSSRRRFVIVHTLSTFIADISLLVQDNKKPCLRFGKQGEKSFFCFSEPAYAEFIQITFGALPNRCHG